MPFPIHPHMLRHACGFKLANDGHDTRALQHYLGHKNIQHTVRYTDMAPDCIATPADSSWPTMATTRALQGLLESLARFAARTDRRVRMLKQSIAALVRELLTFRRDRQCRVMGRPFDHLCVFSLRRHHRLKRLDRSL